VESLRFRNPSSATISSLIAATLGGVLAITVSPPWLVLPATAGIILLLLLFHSQTLSALPIWSRILLFLFTIRPLLDITGPAQQITGRLPLQAIFATITVLVLVASYFLQPSLAKGSVRSEQILWALAALTLLAMFIGPLGTGFDNGVRTLFAWIVGILIGRLFETEDKIETFCRVVFFSSVLVLLIVSAYLDVVEITAGVEESSRLGGQFGVPNTLAGVAFVFFSYGLFVLDKLQSRFQKGAAVALLLALTAVIFRTQSKTVGVMAVVITLAWIAAKKKWKIFGAAFVLVIIVAVVLPQLGVQSRVLSIVPSSDDASEELLTLTGRTILWSAQVQLFDDANILQKFFGVGWGAPLENYRRWGFDETSVTENSYLWLLIGGGIVSFLLFLTLLGAVLYKAVHLLRHPKNEFQRSLASFCLIITLSLAIECSTNDILLAPVIASYHFAIISMFLAHSKTLSNSSHDGKPETTAL
jgi:O-antigen ligase